MQQVSQVWKVIVSAAVTAAVSGLGVLIANLTDNVDVSTVEGVTLGAVIVVLKIIQKTLAPLSNATGVDEGGN